MSEELAVRRDRLRYTKNTTSSRLALLAILFNVLFFVSIYKSDVGNWYYKIEIGASILYNLVFMLLAFLSSEGVKRYKLAFSGLLIILGAIQIVRIFILPVSAHQEEITLLNEATKETETRLIMRDEQFVRCIIWLSLSAACCTAAAVVNIIRNLMLKAHLAELGEKQ